jgi:hypothetical protein
MSITEELKMVWLECTVGKYKGKKRSLNACEFRCKYRAKCTSYQEHQLEKIKQEQSGVTNVE